GRARGRHARERHARGRHSRGRPPSASCGADGPRADGLAAGRGAGRGRRRPLHDAVQHGPLRRQRHHQRPVGRQLLRAGVPARFARARQRRHAAERGVPVHAAAGLPGRGFVPLRPRQRRQLDRAGVHQRRRAKRAGSRRGWPRGALRRHRRAGDASPPQDLAAPRGRVTGAAHPNDFSGRARDPRALPTGVKFLSYLEPSGYGLAAPAALTSMPAFAAGDAALDDLAALAAATALPVDHDRVVAFCVPEHWAGAFEPRHLNIGCTVWETDRLPPHWRGLLARADRIVVPSAHNASVFADAAVGVPVHVVPHLRRHAFNELGAPERATLRRELGVEHARTVFYTINSWEPRKDLPTLLRAFVRAFTAEDPVALVVKTTPQGFGAPPLYPREPAAALAQNVIADAVRAEGSAPPAITLLPYEMSGRGVDALHRIGDAYVSTTH